MSTSTIKPMQTLKGIFSPPKMNHRRDFLRENKLNLRELQRSTCKKPTAIQQNQQGTFQFHAQQQFNANRRSASQTRLPPMKQTGRSTSEHRIANANPSVKPAQPPTLQMRQNGTRCPSCNGRGDMLRTTASSSSGVALKKTESRDKEIQTDDINDEEFLYCALKKCASSEQNCKIDMKSSLTENRESQAINDASARSRKSKSDTNIPPTNRSDKSSHNYYKTDCYIKQDNQPLESNNHNQHEKNPNNEDFNLSTPLTIRSHDRLANGNVHNNDDNDNINFTNLAIDNQQQESGPQSGRSRHTMCSMNTQDGGTVRKKKSTTSSVHKFGSREDIRLPRYLEREKRDKEEQRMREIVRDPHCPSGHFVLSEDERVSALAIAEKKFKSLINELNRMPMTTETLRIRTRKAEIEKELVVLESDIRIFSKPKVYIKHEDLEA